MTNYDVDWCQDCHRWTLWKNTETYVECTVCHLKKYSEKQWEALQKKDGGA